MVHKCKNYLPTQTREICATVAFLLSNNNVTTDPTDLWQDVLLTYISPSTASNFYLFFHKLELRFHIF